MKQVLLINFMSKNESSYVQHYAMVLDQCGVDYDVVYFERYDMNFTAAANELVFKRPCPTGGSKFQKIPTMLAFASFARKALKKKTYDGVIVLTTVPAVMVADILLRDYSGKFILDIRDYTHESNKAYYKLVKKLIDASFCTVLSSRGFQRFLPDCVGKYRFTHNIPRIFELRSTRSLDKSRIAIGFVGSIRYFEENTALVRAMKNAPHFELSYYGTQTIGCDLERYCADQNFEHVFFGGPFNNQDKPAIYENIDLINSIYPAGSTETTTALPNRLYDAAIYGCPIIATKGTYLAECVEQYNLGIAVDILHDDVCSALNSYIETFDAEAFEEGRRRLLGDVARDLEDFNNALTRFATGANLEACGLQGS